MMKIRSFLKTGAAWILAAVATGFLLSGCATDQTGAADHCAGPAYYCNVYFGS